MKARSPWRIAGRMMTMACVACAALVTVMVGEARAGCGDGACGRVDWTEVTEMDQGAPAAAKLHGAYAWEASPDFWATHPLAGTVTGYFWLTCLSPRGPTDAVCKQQLASEMAKAGTDATMTFGGTYFDPDAGVIRPAGLFAESEAGKPAALADLILGATPLNPEVCRAALALPRNGSDAALPDAASGGSGGAGPALDASTGGTSGSGPTPSDDGGCSASGRSSSAHVGFVASVFLAAALEVARRRRRD